MIFILVASLPFGKVNKTGGNTMWSGAGSKPNLFFLGRWGSPAARGRDNISRRQTDTELRMAGRLSGFGWAVCG
jgi:hypothetical protein